MLTEEEMNQRFLDTWSRFGELLVYKSFVYTFPEYAFLYDQIHGSIPHAIEVEVSHLVLPSSPSAIEVEVPHLVLPSNRPATEMEVPHIDQQGNPIIDGCLDTIECSTSLIRSRVALNGLEESSLLVGSGNADGPALEGYTSKLVDKTTIAESTITDKSHNNTNSLQKGGYCVKKSQVCNISNNNKIMCGDKDIVNHVNDKDSIEHHYSDIRKKDNAFKLTGQDQFVSSMSDKEDLNIHEELNSDVKYRKLSHCDQRKSPHSLPIEALYTGEITMNKDPKEKDNLSPVTDISDLPCEIRNIAGFVCSSETLSVINSAESTPASVQISSHFCSFLPAPIENSTLSPENNFGKDEHSYSSLHVKGHDGKPFLDHGSSHDGCSDDAEARNELIATLKDSYEDLKHQIFRHAKVKFIQWLQKCPDEDFDVASLDEDLMTVVYPEPVTEIMTAECKNELMMTN